MKIHLLPPRTSALSVVHALFLATIAALSCRGELTLNAGDPQLKLSGGRWLFHGTPLTGTIQESLPDAIRLTQYAHGLEHGQQTLRTHSGALVEERTYQDGKKHGLHRGWFADGKDRFYTEFSEDHYAGEHWTWHSNGKVAEYKKYTLGGQILVHKHWRESGQIYRNQVFAVNNTQEAGMPGVKICNTVKDTVGSRSQ